MIVAVTVIPAVVTVLLLASNNCTAGWIANASAFVAASDASVVILTVV